MRNNHPATLPTRSPTLRSTRPARCGSQGLGAAAVTREWTQYRAGNTFRTLVKKVRPSKPGRSDHWANGSKTRHERQRRSGGKPVATVDAYGQAAEPTPRGVRARKRLPSVRCRSSRLSSIRTSRLRQRHSSAVRLRQFAAQAHRQDDVRCQAREARQARGAVRNEKVNIRDQDERAGRTLRSRRAKRVEAPGGLDGIWRPASKGTGGGPHARTETG